MKEWLAERYHGGHDAIKVPGAWDGDRLFQAARFATEMQYQHMVFEEFARRIQPMVDPFIFNTSPNVDASIVAEFAHTVYRFGHSMLTGTVDRLENDLTDRRRRAGPEDAARGVPQPAAISRQRRRP